MRSKRKNILTLIIIIAVSLFISPSFAQNNGLKKSKQIGAALTLANIFNALTGKSSKMSLYERNKISVKKVLENGIDFSLTSNIENELIKAGASDELIAAIRLKSKDNSSSTVEPPGSESNSQELPDDNQNEEISPITNSDDLGVAGTWTGTRGMDTSNAFLIISGSKGNKFTGILKLKGFNVAVQGQINLKTRQLIMREMRVIETNNEAGWTLLTFTGAISRDKKEMSGLIKGENGNSQTNIAWTFSKID